MPRDLSAALLAAQHADITDPYVIIILSMLGEEPPLPTTPGILGLQVAPAGGSREFLTYAPDDWSVLSTDTPTGGTYIGTKCLGGKLFRKGSDTQVFRQGEYGYLHRSDNDGAAWADKSGFGADAATGCVDFDRSTDGTLWLLKYTGAGVGFISEIWRSVNDGDTWTPVYTPSSWSYWYGRAICCDPADSNRIIACGRTGSRLTFVYSDDGGSTWHEVDPTDTVSVGTGPNGTQLLFGTGGRLVLAHGTDPLVETSDDWADHWTTRLAPTHGGSRFMHQMVHGSSASEFFLAQTQTGPPEVRAISRSTDNAVTWTEDWALDTDMAINDRIWGLAYDQIGSCLYAHSRTTEAAPPAITVVKWTSAGGWEDITADLYDEASNDPGERGIVVIPS